MVSESALDLLEQITDLQAVYRMFDRNMTLLYVGRTKDAGGRFGRHSGNRWFPLVTTITLEWHQTPEAAAKAEGEAIFRELPRYNVVGKPLVRVRPQSISVMAAVRPKARPQCHAPIPATGLAPDVRTALLERIEHGTTIRRTAAELGVSIWTVRSGLEQLRAEGIAEVIGRNRGARWVKANCAESGDVA